MFQDPKLLKIVNNSREILVSIKAGVKAALLRILGIFRFVKEEITD